MCIFFWFFVLFLHQSIFFKMFVHKQYLSMYFLNISNRWSNKEKFFAIPFHLFLYLLCKRQQTWQLTQKFPLYQKTHCTIALVRLFSSRHKYNTVYQIIMCSLYLRQKIPGFFLSSLIFFKITSLVRLNPSLGDSTDKLSKKSLVHSLWSSVEILALGRKCQRCLLRAS